MQLISALLSIFSVVILVGAALFVWLWHRANRNASAVQMLHEGIVHIGVSAVVEYPDTPQPLIALLEEEYPRSEAVIVTDLQHYLSPFGELIQRFHLIRVNHSHLTEVRALYRSRHRAFRRVVMVDLPIEHRNRAFDIGKEVATYNYILKLHGDSIVAHDALSYCATIVALHHLTKDISMRSFVGADVHFESCDTSDSRDVIHLRSSRILAWQRDRIGLTLFVIFVPAILTLLSYLFDSRMVLFVAMATIPPLVACLYVSCRVVTEKSLFVTLGTILYNFYRFLIERVKNFHYLYKERIDRSRILTKGVAVINRIRKTNRESP